MPEPFGGFADDEPLPPQQKKTLGQKFSETNIGHALQEIFGAVTLPGDVAAGRVDPMSDEAIGRSFDLATLGAGGGAAPEKITGARTLREWWRPKVPTQPQAAEASLGQAESMARRFDPASEIPGVQGQMLAGSAEEGGALMQHGLRRAAEMEKEGATEQFKLSTGDFGGTAKPASIGTDAVMGMPMQIVQDLQANRISLAGNPQATAIMKDINTKINGLAARNRGVPSSGQVTNFNLSGVDLVKNDMNRRLGLAVESGNGDDVKAVHSIMESFDRQVDSWVNSKKFKGDPRAIKAWNIARHRENLYREKFTSSAREPAGTVVEKILGENKHGPQTGKEVAEYAIGSIGINPPQYNAKVITGIRDILGERSPEWAGARQGTFMNLVTPNQQAWKPREIKTNILDFLDGKGREVANVMFSPQERQTMRQFATVQGHLDIAKLPQGTTASTVPQRITGSLVGLILGTMDIKTKLIHEGISVAMAQIRQTKELRDLNYKMSSVRSHVATWWKKVDPTGKDPTSRTQKMKTFTATRTLTDSLKRLGIGGIDTRGAMAEQPDKIDKLSFGGPGL